MDAGCMRFGPFCEVPSISNGAYKVGLLDIICVVFRDILSKSLDLKIGYKVTTSTAGTVY